MRYQQKGRRCAFLSLGYTHLLCDKNLPVEWPLPSHPGIGHLKKFTEKDKQKKKNSMNLDF